MQLPGCDSLYFPHLADVSTGSSQGNQNPEIIWLYAYEFHPQTTQTPADLWRNLSTD